MNKQELQQIIYKEVLILKEKDNSFFLTENDSNWIFDFRNAFMKGELLEKFATYFWDKYEDEYPFQVGGLEVGAIPFISGIILEGQKRGKNTNGFFVRKDRKATGLGKKIEGKLNNESVIIVDDLFNSGISIKKVYDAIISEGGGIKNIFTFIHFGNEKGINLLNEIKIKLEYEFTLSDFGLDRFGNSLSLERKNDKLPVIFPDYNRIYSLKNPNQFIEVPKSNPIKEGKYIYMGGEGGKFVCICSDTGTLIWEFQVHIVTGHKNILSSAILVGDKILFGSYDGNFYCLDKNTGKQVWVNIDADWIGSSPCYSDKYNLIYVGGEHGGAKNKGSLMALDIESGETKWQQYFDDFVHGSPGYSKETGLVICGSNNGTFICVHGGNGKKLYRRQFKSSMKGGFAFSQDGKKAYFGCFDHCIYSLNILNGNIEWFFKTDNIIYTTPYTLKDNIFVGSTDKYFYHFDVNGKLLKKIKTFGKILTQPIYVTGDIILFGSNDSYLYFYDYLNKRVLFVVEHGERIATKVIYDDVFGHLYILNFMNELYKYDIGSYLKNI